MYLPLSLSFLRFIQLPLSSSTPKQAGAPSAQSKLHHGDYRDFGILSPYHDTPNIPGVLDTLPGDCTVEHVIMLHRHGSRGPEFEHKFIRGLVETLDNAQDTIQAISLPSNLQFLKQGFALRYPTFSTDIVVSSPVQRVVDSSHFFAHGFFGLNVENITFRTVTDLDDLVSWITPWKSCPKFSHHQPHQLASQWAAKYVLPIAERLEKFLPGVNITVNDTRGALYACPFDLAARNQSPWCNAFSTRELRNLEYEYDLLMDGISGHASKGDIGPLLGAFYIKKLVERLTNATGDAVALYLEFGHDTSILLPLSTMGLNKDTSPLNPYHVPVRRRFKTSEQTPFAAYMVWEKFICENSFKGPQVRLVLNGATFPLTICEKSRKDKKYGTCSLAEFARANEYSTRIRYKGKSWNNTCEVDDQQTIYRHWPLHVNQYASHDKE